MKQIKALLFEAGPLHEQRHEFESFIKQLPVKTGDIFCRLGMQKFMGLPFEKLVARATKSSFSHASVALVHEGEIYLLEVNDMGTMLIRFIDWLDYCGTMEFAIYRLPLNDHQIDQVDASILKFTQNDPDYDYQFLPDNDKFYCTESVAYIYKDAGIPLSDPVYIKDIFSPLKYKIIYSLNWVVSKLTGKSLPMTEPAYFVGNSEKGLLSTPNISLVFDSTK